MPRSETTPRPRRLATLLGAVLLPGALVAPFLSPSPAGGDPVAEKRAEAERIARDLEMQGRRVSLLSEELNEARLEAERVAGEVSAAEAHVAETDRRLGTARDRLARRAVASYIRGGRLPLVQLLVGATVDDLPRRRSYVEAVVGQEQAAIAALRSAREEHAARRAGLASAQRSAREVLATVEARRQAAADAADARRATLARVQGELGALVEAEARRRAEEEARRAREELAARQARLEAARREADRRAREDGARRAREDAARRAREDGARRADEAGRRVPPVAPPPESSGGEGSAGKPAAGAGTAVAEARRQLGKPYEYGGSGPDTFDCSGLTAWAWRAGGKTLPHSSRAQYGATSRVAVSDIAPGDLVFYGNPIHHVGIYVGDGMMVEASETGTPVRYASIYRRDMVGVGRVG